MNKCWQINNRCHTLNCFCTNPALCMVWELPSIEKLLIPEPSPPWGVHLPHRPSDCDSSQHGGGALTLQTTWTPILLTFLAELTSPSLCPSSEKWAKQSLFRGRRNRWRQCTVDSPAQGKCSLENCCVPNLMSPGASVTFAALTDGHMVYLPIPRGPEANPSRPVPSEHSGEKPFPAFCSVQRPPAPLGLWPSPPQTTFTVSSDLCTSPASFLSLMKALVGPSEVIQDNLPIQEP